MPANNNDHPVARFVLPAIARFAAFVFIFQTVCLIVSGRVGADSGQMLANAALIAVCLTFANLMERE